MNWRLATQYPLRMCARHVDSTNPGRSNLVFSSKPITEAEMSNRLIDQRLVAEAFVHLVFCDSVHVTLESSLTKNLTFPYTSIILLVVATISFIADIYIAPLQVGLLRSAPNPNTAE